jgi:hypothetical protein
MGMKQEVRNKEIIVMKHHHQHLERLVGLVALAFLAVGLLLPSSSTALTTDFYCITYNNPTDCGSAEAQLQVQITDLGGNQTLFLFENMGPSASSIADIYFAGGSLLRIASIDNSDPGVSFSIGATPANLPGGKSISQPFRATFALDADAPVQPMGVNPGESLGVVMDLQPGATYSDILSELNSGELRVGLHVQGFDGGGSESLINKPVPEPSTALLLCIGLIGLTGSRCRPKTTLRPRSSILSD